MLIFGFVVILVSGFVSAMMDGAGIKTPAYFWGIGVMTGIIGIVLMLHGVGALK